MVEGSRASGVWIFGFGVVGLLEGFGVGWKGCGILAVGLEGVCAPSSL